MFATRSLPSNSPLRGISMVEMTILLAIVGLIIGGVWATAASVHSRNRIATTVNAILDTANRTKGLHTGFPNKLLPGTVAAQITGGYFSTTFVNGTTTQNPWGGTVTLALNPANTPNRSFFITLNGLNNSVCRDLATAIPLLGRDGYPNSVRFNNGGFIVPTNANGALLSPLAIANNAPANCASITFRFAM